MVAATRDRSVCPVRTPRLTDTDVAYSDANFSPCITFRVRSSLRLSLRLPVLCMGVCVARCSVISALYIKKKSIPFLVLLHVSIISSFSIPVPFVCAISSSGLS